MTSPISLQHKHEWKNQIDTMKEGLKDYNSTWLSSILKLRWSWSGGIRNRILLILLDVRASLVRRFDPRRI